MAKRPRYSRWRRLPGLYRLGEDKGPDPNLEPQRLTLCLPGTILDAAEAQAKKAGIETIQEYCTDLLRCVIEAERVREQVAEVEARRGPSTPGPWTRSGRSRRPLIASSRERTSAITPPIFDRRTRFDLVRLLDRRRARRRPAGLGDRPPRDRRCAPAGRRRSRQAGPRPLSPGRRYRARLRRHPAPAGRGDRHPRLEPGHRLSRRRHDDHGPGGDHDGGTPRGPGRAAPAGPGRRPPSRSGDGGRGLRDQHERPPPLRSGAAARPAHRRQLRHVRWGPRQGGWPGRQERRRLRLPQALDRLARYARHHHPAHLEGPPDPRGRLPSSGSHSRRPTASARCSIGSTRRRPAPSRSSC